MRRLFFGSSGGTNPVMMLKATFLGSREREGLLIYGGKPQPNGIYIKEKKYNIAKIVILWDEKKYAATSCLSFKGDALPCNSIELDIKGTVYTVRNNGKYFISEEEYFTYGDEVFEENKTYTIKVLSIA